MELIAKNATQSLTSAFCVAIILLYKMVYANVETAFSWTEIHVLSVVTPAQLVKILISVRRVQLGLNSETLSV